MPTNDKGAIGLLGVVLVEAVIAVLWRGMRIAT